MAAQVKIYTRDYCGFCTAALALLKKKQVAFEHIDCTGDPTMRTWLERTTGRSTVPQIFIDGTPVGGFDDLNALERRGELDPLLAGTRNLA